MKCDICGSRDSYVKMYTHNYITKGKNISFKSKRRFCKACNNLVYDSELDNIASKLALETYSKEYGITKEEIIALRKRYDLSQELFSKIIGCAKKTLVSYEKGDSIPNDSYLILLKSINNNPETILTIIESNKDLFNNKDYIKINNKVANNIKQLHDESSFIPTEYNGYSNLSKDKIYNIILYLSSDNILKTKLLKEMFYIDFLYYKNNCKSLTGLEYAKLPYGPVPDQFEEIINTCSKENIINYEVVFENNYECHNIKANKKFNKDIFSKEELEIIELVKNNFKKYSSKDIVEYSHKEKAFKEPKYGDKISYDYAFDIESF